MSQLQTYKNQIPSLFTYNEALVILDGLQARIGTLTARPPAPETGPVSLISLLLFRASSVDEFRKADGILGVRMVAVRNRTAWLSPRR